MPVRSFDADALAQRLRDAEVERLLGSLPGLVLGVGKLLEASLQTLALRAATTGELRECCDAFKDDATYGELLGLVRTLEKKKGARVIDVRHAPDLERFRLWRNAIAHAKEAQSPPDMKAVEVFLDETVVPFLDEQGLLQRARCQRVRSEAFRERRRHTHAVETELDRDPQRGRVVRALEGELRAPVLALAVDGEAQQGHEAFVTLFRSSIERFLRLNVEEPVTPYLAWPSALPGSGARLANLFAALGLRFKVDTPPPAPDPLNGDPEAWVEWLDQLRGRIFDASVRRRVFIRHRISALAAEDLPVLEAYLDRLWFPVAQSLAEDDPVLRVLLLFEMTLPRRSWVPWRWWSWRGARQRARGFRARVALDGAPGFEAVEVPELDSVPPPAIEGFLRERGFARADAATHAAGLWRKSEGGRFEPLVSEIRDLLLQRGQSSMETKT